MRPRPEGRGEPNPEIAFRRGAFCFNAATTRRPWRTVRFCGAIRFPSGFNAATTRRPWRTSRAVCMGLLLPKLQCGHDPKAVENHRLIGVQRPSSPQLQCGHDPKAVENFGPLRSRMARRRGFNAATTRRPWRTLRPPGQKRGMIRASMRPRPEGRGERVGAARGPGPTNALQCGHDPKAVENYIYT